MIGIDWTFAHHERGKEIFGVKKAYDYVEKRMSRYQTVVTAAIANKDLIDGLEVIVVACHGRKSERFMFAEGRQTIGQKLYCLTREALGQLLSLAETWLATGQSCANILELLMPI